MGIEIVVNPDDLKELEKLDDRLHEPPKTIMKRIAEDVLAPAVQRHLLTGNFPPLSKVTLELRKRAGYPGSTPLQASMKLLGSIKPDETKYSAVAFVAFPAAPLQKGYTTGGWIKGKRVPPRKFVYLDDRDMREAESLVAQFYDLTKV